MPANETIMLMTLSYFVVVRTFLVGSGAGSADGVSATVGGSADGASATVGGSGAGFSCLFAMMAWASIRAFFVPRELVLFFERCPWRHVLGFFVS